MLNERGEYVGPVDVVEETWEDLPDGGRGKMTKHFFEGKLVRQDYHVILPATWAEGVVSL